MTTLQDLRAKQEELRKQQEEIARSIDDMKSAQRSGVIAEIKDLMAQHGLTVADLTPGTRSARVPAEGKTKEVSKVAIKYRDAETGSTWTGRGLKPRWLVAALEAGRSLEEFLVEAQPAE
ncbi:H-NS histone family protein [Sphaerotilus uruguayifluvii]|uniref:DNA-binding protein H-NS n=1 Tax=Sphaerotilus uruguayifluvii TaxID=2735897 RepID=A0ABX2G6M8_9BURK|nr:H-NS histone family protein [Leptothrix sp. C29]NRT57704.1 DNA-binding protein H-NS [Leptothrix sp. C29]